MPSFEKSVSWEGEREWCRKSRPLQNEDESAVVVTRMQRISRTSGHAREDAARRTASPRSSWLFSFIEFHTTCAVVTSGVSLQFYSSPRTVLVRPTMCVLKRKQSCALYASQLSQCLSRCFCCFSFRSHRDIGHRSRFHSNGVHFHIVSLANCKLLLLLSISVCPGQTAVLLSLPYCALEVHEEDPGNTPPGSDLTACPKTKQHEKPVWGALRASTAHLPGAVRRRFGSGTHRVNGLAAEEQSGGHRWDRDQV